MKTVPCIVSIMTLIGMCFGVYFWANNQYASAETVKMIEQRLDYKIKNDQEMAIKERIWKIEDKYGTVPKDITIREELRGLKNDLGSINGQIKTMEKK
jgi:hypothetical protein